ncbi:MAG: hypothetical protein JSS23_03070 [Proteobacteria bacterium]|nr:hypothetical protein [Pseudomonadota bacterium]
MHNFIHTGTGAYPVTFAQLRAEHPLTLFPEGFAEDFGDYAPVRPTAMPDHDHATHKAVEMPPVLMDDQWHQAWEVSALTQEDIDAARRALVPAKVTRRQARQALLLAGLLGSVQPAIDAIEDATQRQLAQIEWDDSLEFERNRPLLIRLAHAIGLDDAGLDNLFIQAGGL